MPFTRVPSGCAQTARVPAEHRPSPNFTFTRDLPLTQNAVEFARDRHAGQRRPADGASLLLHPLEGASLLDRSHYPDMSSQPPSCTTFWKTPMRSSELEARFGSEVSDLVALVSDDASVTDEEARKDECVRESAALAGTPPSSTPRTRSQRRESSARCCTGGTDYLLVAGIVFWINLLPAFGPPAQSSSR
jgi:hypothetical protein